MVHLGSNSPLIGFTIRPQHKRKTDTCTNLRENPYLTINSIQNNKGDFMKKRWLKSYPHSIVETLPELNITRKGLL